MEPHPRYDDVTGQIAATRGDAVRMSRKAETALVHFISEARPFDWSPIEIRQAVRRAVMEYGDKYSAAAIGQAAMHAAGNLLNASPDCIWRKGPHWDNLPQYLRTDAEGRTHASQHDRELIEDAREAKTRLDPALQAKWRDAALAAIRSA